MAWGPGGSWHEWWIHPWLEAPYSIQCELYSKARWELVSITLCSPRFVPSRDSNHLFPQDSPQIQGLTFSGLNQFTWPIIGARTMPCFEGQGLNHVSTQSMQLVNGERGDIPMENQEIVTYIREKGSWTTQQKELSTTVISRLHLVYQLKKVQVFPLN